MSRKPSSLVTVTLLFALVSSLIGGAGLVNAERPQSLPFQAQAGTPAPPPEEIFDRDGNRIFENLERRMAEAGDEQAFPVIVVFDRPLGQVDEEGLRRQIGAFGVKHRLSSINALSGTLTKGQIRAASHLPFVKQIEYNAPVQAALDGARKWSGVDAASAAWGVTGNLVDPGTYSDADVVVAVIDSGIDRNHVDLDGGKVIAFKDYVGTSTVAYDDNGHGTHVSSMIAGTGEGNSLYTGVAPGAALVGIKVLDAGGSGDTANVVAAIDWLLTDPAAPRVDVVNLSLGVPGSSDGSDAMSLAIDAVANGGIVPVVAAGNAGPWQYTVGSPGAAAGAITVGAMADVSEMGFNIASFSSRGPAARNVRTKPDIAAPGYNIMAAQAGTTSGYVAYSGTSMATPFTAGVVALMLARNPALTVDQIKSLLFTTAVDWGPAGKDNEYGHGRLDALAAIRAVNPDQSPAGPPVPPHLYFSGRLTSPADADVYELPVSDTSKPLALALVVRNANCTYMIAVWNWCLQADFDYDLELYDPDGLQVATSILPDRQDTINYTPTKTGTYRARVYVCDGCGYNDDYYLDISGAGAAAPPPTNQPPVALADAYSTAEDTTLTVAAPGVLANDGDPDGNPLTAVLVTGPSHGTLSLNVDGSFVYTPASNYNGGDSFTYRASDGSLQSTAATVSLSVSAVNDPPVATFTASCSGLSCNFDGAGSSDPDGDTLNYNWAFGDGASGSVSTTTHTYGTAGTWTVNLTVRDPGGLTSSQSQAITVTGTTLAVHIGDLDGSPITATRNWKAVVTILVHDSSHNPVGNAVVSGTWSKGAKGSGSCTTNAAGVCSISTGNLKLTTSSATFTAGSVTLSNYQYVASVNHDPDGDSTGTVITISR